MAKKLKKPCIMIDKGIEGLYIKSRRGNIFVGILIVLAVLLMCAYLIFSEPSGRRAYAGRGIGIVGIIFCTPVLCDLIIMFIKEPLHFMINNQGTGVRIFCDMYFVEWDNVERISIDKNEYGKYLAVQISNPDILLPENSTKIIQKLYFAFISKPKILTANISIFPIPEEEIIKIIHRYSPKEVDKEGMQCSQKEIMQLPI